jgi:hypothetical protein
LGRNFRRVKRTFEIWFLFEKAGEYGQFYGKIMDESAFGGNKKFFVSNIENFSKIFGTPNKKIFLNEAIA